jgi:hypothetical protein
MTTPMEFSERCMVQAADLALLFCGQPDAKVGRALEQMCANLRTELAKEFSAEVDVQKVVDLFADAVLRRKREIETSSFVGEQIRAGGPVQPIWN